MFPCHTCLGTSLHPINLSMRSPDTIKKNHSFALRVHPMEGVTKATEGRVGSTRSSQSYRLTWNPPSRIPSNLVKLINLAPCTQILTHEQADDFSPECDHIQLVEGDVEERHEAVKALEKDTLDDQRGMLLPQSPASHINQVFKKGIQLEALHEVLG